MISFIIVTSAVSRHHFIAQALAVVENGQLGEVIATTDPHPTRAVAKQRLLGVMHSLEPSDGETYHRAQAVGQWRIE